MRCSDVGSAEQIPDRIEPALGQRPENGGQSVGNNGRNVLQEHEARSHIANDSLDGGPEPAVVGEPPSLPGEAERLARESRNDEIHDSTPRAAIEGVKVVPDRSEIQGRFFHPCHESGRSVGVPLDMTDSAVSGDGIAEPKIEPRDAGTK